MHSEVNMSRKEMLEAELKKAMLENQPMVKKVVRLALSAIKLTEVEVRRPLSDQEVISILQKEIANREETISEAKKINRVDLIEENEAEIGLIKTYLPAQLSESELLQIINEVISTKSGVTLKDMGAIIKETISRVEGRAPNNAVSGLVKHVLTNQ